MTSAPRAMSKITSPEEYQELGRRYYKLKQYDKALEALTSGIDAQPTLNTYDYRAATYEKLADFKSAVRDGREMINLDKKDVRGYLRTAKVLENMEKPETALGIYKYGMKNVPVSDTNFKLLQQLHDKLTRKLSPATATDPFSVFPPEIAEMVLKYMSFREMVNCMRVSKGWKEYIAKLDKLWLHLDLSGARRPVSRKFVNNAVRCSNAKLTRLTVHRFEHLDMLSNIARVCKELAEIRIISLPYTASSTFIEMARLAQNLTKFIVQSDMTLDTASQILSKRPNLEAVEFSTVAVGKAPQRVVWLGPFPTLKLVKIRFVEVAVLEVVLQSLLAQCPSLETLELGRIQTMGLQIAIPGMLDLPLKNLVLKDIKMLRFPILPPTLERLVIESGNNFNAMGSLSLVRALIVPNLTELCLWSFGSLSAEWFIALLDIAETGPNVFKSVSGKPLKSLSLRGTLDNEDETRRNGLFNGPTSLLGSSPRILTPSLEFLDIATMPCGDDQIDHLLGYNVNLTSIDLSSTKITGASIKRLVDKQSKLREIKAHDCVHINGRDAIVYAEKKGVSVLTGLGNPQGGRKIRYG